MGGNAFALARTPRFASHETLPAVARQEGDSSVSVYVGIRACTSLCTNLAVTLTTVRVAQPMSEAQIPKPEPQS